MKASPDSKLTFRDPLFTKLTIFNAKPLCFFGMYSGLFQRIVSSNLCNTIIIIPYSVSYHLKSDLKIFSFILPYQPSHYHTHKIINLLILTIIIINPYISCTQVLIAVILVIGSVSALGSGPYLPSGWRPQGPSFFLPSEVEVN